METTTTLAVTADLMSTFHISQFLSTLLQLYLSQSQRSQSHQMEEAVQYKRVRLHI